MNDALPGYKAREFDIKNLVLFFLIAFGWTWFWWFLFILGVLRMPAGVGTPDIDLKTAGPILLIVILSPFGPTIGAFLVTARTKGRTGVRDLWRRFWKRKLTFGWLIVLFVFYPLVRLIARYSAQWLGGVPQAPFSSFAQPWLILPPLIASILNGGLSEEFGWRGYALRHLQSKWNALTAAVVLGFIEGCWHIPLVFMPGDERFGMPIWALVLPYLAVGVFRAWIFNNTNGSVLAAALFHAAGNTAGEIVPPLSAPFRFFWDLILYLVAFVIVLLFGPRTLIRGKRVRRKPAVRTNDIRPAIGGKEVVDV